MVSHRVYYSRRLAHCFSSPKPLPMAAQFVASLMVNKFMFKGTEDPQNVSDLHTNSDRVLRY